MINAMPFQHPTTFIEQNVLKRLEKMFLKIYSKVPHCGCEKQ